MCVDAKSRARSDQVPRLCNLVSLGDRIDNWRVSWVGAWDKCRVFFVVMVEREHEHPTGLADPKDAVSESVALR
jgi:hypothetical protein